MTRLETVEVEFLEAELDDSLETLRHKPLLPVVLSDDIAHFGLTMKLLDIDHSNRPDDFIALFAHDSPVVEGWLFRFFLPHGEQLGRFLNRLMRREPHKLGRLRVRRILKHGIGISDNKRTQNKSRRFQDFRPFVCDWHKE